MMRPRDIDLDQYHRYRKIMRRHHSALVKTIPRSTILGCARKLRIVEGNKLVLESESDLTVLMDYCLYSDRRRGRTLVEKYLEKLPASDNPEEQAVRAAMGRARFWMFQIERVKRGTGATVRNLVRGDSLFVVDEGMSKSMKKGGLLGYRVVPLPDYWITTGAGFPLSREIVELIESLFVLGLKISGGDVANLRAEAEEELATVVIGAAFQEGMTSEIEYI